MKKFKFFMVLLLSIAVILPGCFSDDDDDDKDSGPKYFISFTEGSSEVTFSDGFTETDGYPVASFDTTDSESSIYAADGELSYSAWPPDDGIMLSGFSGKIAGTDTVDIAYYKDGTAYVGTVSMTISEYGDEGEEVTGTFATCTVTAGSDSITLSDGSFTVYNSGDE